VNSENDTRFSGTCTRLNSGPRPQAVE